MSQVKFCEANFEYGTEEVMNKLKENYKDLDISTECIGYCGECASGPIALVNDEFVQADTADELYDTIVSML